MFSADLIRGINDPEHPLTLEELNVVDEDNIQVCFSPCKLYVIYILLIFLMLGRAEKLNEKEITELAGNLATHSLPLGYIFFMLQEVSFLSQSA